MRRLRRRVLQAHHGSDFEVEQDGNAVHSLGIRSGRSLVQRRAGQDHAGPQRPAGHAVSDGAGSRQGSQIGRVEVHHRRRAAGGCASAPRRWRRTTGDTEVDIFVSNQAATIGWSIRCRRPQLDPARGRRAAIGDRLEVTREARRPGRLPVIFQGQSAASRPFPVTDARPRDGGGRAGRPARGRRYRLEVELLAAPVAWADRTPRRPARSPPRSTPTPAQRLHRSAGDTRSRSTRRPARRRTTTPRCSRPHRRHDPEHRLHPAA